MESSFWHTVGTLCHWCARGLRIGHMLAPDYEDGSDILGPTRSLQWSLARWTGKHWLKQDVLEESFWKEGEVSR